MTVSPPLPVGPGNLVPLKRRCCGEVVMWVEGTWRCRSRYCRTNRAGGVEVRLATVKEVRAWHVHRARKGLLSSPGKRAPRVFVEREGSWGAAIVRKELEGTD